MTTGKIKKKKELNRKQKKMLKSKTRAMVLSRTARPGNGVIKSHRALLLGALFDPEVVFFWKKPLSFIIIISNRVA